MSIANLRRASAALLKQIQTNVQNETAKRSYGDSRYWFPIVDKNGNGSAIIRFLPPILVKDVNDPNYKSPYVQSLLRTAYVEGEPSYEPPCVRKWTNNFKGKKTGLWYIENNRNSLGIDDERVPDPCADLNSELWKTDIPSLVQQARDQKRKQIFISNIQVIKHKEREDDEGKVFLFGYGKKICEKINAIVNPDSGDGIAPVDVFNFDKGANFHLKIRNVEGYRNYDTSSFLSPTPLADNDAALEKIYSEQYSLLDEVGLDKFKSYESLEAQLHRVLDLREEDEAPREQPRPRPTATAPTARATQADEPPFEVDEDGVVTETVVTSTSPDAKAYFKTLSKKA